MQIYGNGLVDLTERDDYVYITVSSTNIDMKVCNQIFSDFPRIKITNFINLKRGMTL